MLPLFDAHGCGERVSFLPEGWFCGVIGDDVVLREEFVDPVHPKCKRGLEAFDTVGETEKVVEDLGYLVCYWCMDTRPQKGFGCREAGQHYAKAGLSDVRRVLVVQRRGVGEPDEYLKPEIFLTECGIRGTQRVPQVCMGQREQMCKRAHGGLESRRENLVQFLGKEEVMGVDKAG